MTIQRIKIKTNLTYELESQYQMGHSLIVITYLALFQKSGLLFYILKVNNFSILDVHNKTGWISSTYLEIGLRLMVACGWLNFDNNKIKKFDYLLTPEGKAVFSSVDQNAVIYSDLLKFLRFCDKTDLRFYDKKYANNCDIFYKVINFFKNNWYLPQDDSRVFRRLKSYLDGFIVSLNHISFLMHNQYKNLNKPLNLHKEEINKLIFDEIVLILITTQYIYIREKLYSLTKLGEHACETYSGWLQISYLRLFVDLEDLLLSESKTLENEINLSLNLQGSNIATQRIIEASHLTSKWIPEIFQTSKTCDVEQVKYICDIGAGSGGFLLAASKGLNSSKYYQNSYSHRFTFIGGDIDDKSIKIIEKTLEDAKLSFLVLKADVGKPKELLVKLKKIGLKKNSIFYIRSFVDHNRSISGKKNSSDISKGNGVYLSKNGYRLSSEQINSSLKQHFEAWRKQLSPLGMLIIELHASDPIKLSELHDIVPLEIEYIQLLTAQYPVEYKIWISCAIKAGLKIKKSICFNYGKSETTFISVTHFVP